MFLELTNTRGETNTYSIKFSRNGTTTYAELWVVEEWGLDPTGLLGIANLYYKDNFVKSKGRKAALARLLVRMNEVSAGEDVPVFSLTKEDREKIWAKYFETHRR